MKTRAAVAYEAGKPLVIEEVELEGPKAGEVLVEIKATGVCHTDEFTRSGADPEGLFPVIFGHEGAGIVVDVGPGVTSVAEGRPRHPALHARVPRLQVVPLAQDQPLHGDPRHAGQGRHARRHQPLLDRRHEDPPLHGLLDLREPHRAARRSRVAKVRKDAPFDKICYIGCGVTTGIGAVIYTAKVEPGANVVVFGLGGIGLNVVQGARLAGADKIIGVDLNPAREALARKFGLTHFVNPKQLGGDLVAHLVELTGGGADYSFECVGNVEPDAPGARVLPPRLGRQRHHRRRRRRAGDRHAPVPAGHRPRVEGHRVRRRARPHRRAAASSTGTWTGRSTSTA